MEYIEGANSLIDVFGSWTKSLRIDLDRPFRLSGDLVTCFELAKKAMVALGSLHGHFWMDQEFADASPWVCHQEWMRG